VNLQRLKKLCASFPGATHKLSGEPSNVLVYYIGGKFFAYFKTSDPEKWRFSIRVSPDRFLELTGMPDIKPARYMGRFHWVTIVNIESLPDDYLRELLEWSYQKAYTALTRKKREEIASISSTMKRRGE
jgi:predicted DNA-binding protein (MmcQ/YjbR family)